MRKVNYLIGVALAAMSLAAFNAQARGGGMGGGMGAGVGAGMSAGVGGGSVGLQAGGMSSSHMSGHGIANTNGFSASDRDTGMARAQDRSSTHANLADSRTRTRYMHTRHHTARRHEGKHVAHQYGHASN